jgi:hypothetical protein
MMTTVKDYIDNINALSMAMMKGQKKYRLPSKRIVKLPELDPELEYADRLCKAKILAKDILSTELISLS